MSYEMHELEQGSDLWHNHRTNCCNASDAGTAMGINPYKTRQELVREMATGITKEIDADTQRRFDDGHRFEKLARPLAEKIVGEDLFPIVASIAVPGLKRRLSASLDGNKADDSETWEHKTLSKSLAAALARGEIPEQYEPQMEQGMTVVGASRCLFMASKWEKAGADVVEAELNGENGKVYGRAEDENGILTWYVLIEETHVWYESNPVLRDRIIPIWKQAEADADNYHHVEAAPVAVAEPIKDLPAVVLTVSGALSIETNFEIWGRKLQAFIDRLPERVPEKLSTDQEFEDCKAAIAAFKKAEAMLDAEEGRVLSMVADIDEMQRTKKLMRDLSSTTRLILEKRAVSRDREVKIEIMQAGKDALAEHIAGLNKRLATVQMPPIAADFAAAIKGKKLYDNMRGAVADLVAAKKIESNEIADKIDANLKVLNAAGNEHLFRDYAALVMKAPDDMALVISTRIDADKKRINEENERILEAERVKIRAEEEARATAKAKAEQEEAERQRKASTQPATVAVQTRQEPAPQPAPTSSSGRLEETAGGAAPSLGQVLHAVAPPQIANTLAPIDTGATMKLGEIGDRLEFNVTADFLERLGFPIHRTDKNAKLYRACDFPAICAAIVRHVQAVANSDVRRAA